MLTEGARTALAEALASHLESCFGSWSPWTEDVDGHRARVRMLPDPEGDRFTAADMGVLKATRDGKRPATFNGAARKFAAPDGPVWWQPPAGVVADPESLGKLAARVRSYLLEYWSYTGLQVEVMGPSCACCGECKREKASLWGIESDCPEYHREVLADLLAGVSDEGGAG